MNVIGPIIIVIEVLWILVLYFRINALKRTCDQLSGYLAGILNNDNLVKESIETLSIAFGVDPEKLVVVLERMKNESK